MSESGHSLPWPVPVSAQAFLLYGPQGRTKLMLPRLGCCSQLKLHKRTGVHFGPLSLTYGPEPQDLGASEGPGVEYIAEQVHRSVLFKGEGVLAFITFEKSFDTVIKGQSDMAAHS